MKFCSLGLLNNGDKEFVMGHSAKYQTEVLAKVLEAQAKKC